MKVNSDQPLRLMEAAELLGFASIAQGDVVLTPLGKTFVEASILARKEIFAARMKRLPIIRWLLSMLTAADEHRLEGDVVRAALELDFVQEEAARQLDTAVRWGRYAELLAYDDNTESIYLEPGGGFPLNSSKRDGEAGKSP